MLILEATTVEARPKLHSCPSLPRSIHSARTLGQPPFSASSALLLSCQERKRVVAAVAAAAAAAAAAEWIMGYRSPRMSLFWPELEARPLRTT